MNNPMLYPLIRLATRLELRSQGLGRLRINEILDGATDDVIDLAVTQSAAGAAIPVGAIGDGTLIKLFTDFLKSDLGKALIAALLALLGL